MIVKCFHKISILDVIFVIHIFGYFEFYPISSASKYATSTVVIYKMSVRRTLTNVTHVAYFSYLYSCSWCEPLCGFIYIFNIRHGDNNLIPDKHVLIPTCCQRHRLASQVPGSNPGMAMDVYEGHGHGDWG